MYTHSKRLNLLTGILCMVLVVMIAISESESMSLNEHSSNDEIEDEIVERFERDAGKNADKKDHKHHNKHHHKHDKNKKKHHKPKNETVSDNSNRTESMYANKKIDVNKKAEVIGAEMKSQKPVKHAHVKVTEVADEGSKTGVIVAVVLVLITVLGVGAAVFIVKKKRAQGKS